MSSARLTGDDTHANCQRRSYPRDAGLRWRQRLGSFVVLIAVALMISACDSSGPSPTEGGVSLVHRDVAGWSFYEASEQTGPPPPISADDAVRVAIPHLRDQYGLSEPVDLAEALYRRRLTSVEGYGAGATSMREADAWVLRFTDERGETRAWVVVAADGEVNGSWNGY